MLPLFVALPLLWIGPNFRRVIALLTPIPFLERCVPCLTLALKLEAKSSTQNQRKEKLLILFVIESGQRRRRDTDNGQALLSDVGKCCPSVFSTSAYLIQEIMRYALWTNTKMCNLEYFLPNKQLGLILSCTWPISKEGKVCPMDNSGGKFNNFIHKEFIARIPLYTSNR